MDPKTPGHVLLAPARSSSAAVRLPGRPEALPVDEHLVQPEATRDEIVRGRKVVAMPALPPHGDQHCRLDYVVTAHVAPGWISSTDMLTRVADGSDFATDTSIRREGVDPRTQGRYLEEVAFEVVYEQSPRDMKERAEDLTSRGVRRVFAIFVKRREVCEWSRDDGGWVRLGPEAVIEDPCLQQPLAVSALLDASAADDAVARALRAKSNPVISEVRQEGRKEGQFATLGEQFARRLGRSLTSAELSTLGERLDRLGLGPIDDVLMDHKGDALAAWLADPPSR